ncbi:MAG: NAD(P)-dependent glycerol-3-phosphate dehydrogenase [Pyrinomonadaceae bacterium]|nr:NAD(P)-dependent glycerol-3-phosphate dehydrogenase [Pyrinomonadaceae bacterium]
MQVKIAVIGAGSWGTALGIVAGRAGHDVRLWSRDAAAVEFMKYERVNSKYLAGHTLPGTVEPTSEFDEALAGAEIVLLVVPSHGMREVLSSMLPRLTAGMIFVSATKGIEIETGKRISEILRESLKERFEPRFVCLSGPSFAKEVAEGQPTAVVAAGNDLNDAVVVQEALSFQNLRVYTNTDVVGTELGGAVKNVMAVAAGMVAGLGFGSNSVAALITRGLAEMTRLALSQGARMETLMGLAGLGDLVLTSTGSLSRNRYVGQEIGRGRTLEEILSGMSEVAEGVKTTRAVHSLALKLNVEMPITEEVHAVLYEGKSAREAAEALMTRPLRGEFER